MLPKHVFSAQNPKWGHFIFFKSHFNPPSIEQLSVHETSETNGLYEASIYGSSTESITVMRTPESFQEEQATLLLNDKSNGTFTTANNESVKDFNNIKMSKNTSVQKRDSVAGARRKQIEQKRKEKERI